MMTLFEHSQKREDDRRRFYASVHGATIVDDPKKLMNSQESVPEVPDASARVPMFGDPDDYKKLSEAEQNELTEKMKRKHKNWANKPLHPPACRCIVCVKGKSKVGVI